MTTKIPNNTQPKPLDIALGDRLKDFPKTLSKGSSDAPKVSGPAAAAFTSAGFSCFMLMVNQHFSSVFERWNAIVWSIGDWIPGSRNPDPFYGEIGSYTGKETIMLISWLVSWLILHQIWKAKQIQSTTMIVLLMFFLVCATIMNWHPIFPYLALAPK